MVVTCETQKLVDFADVLGADPVCDSFDFRFFHTNRASSNAYSQEVKVVLFEYTLLWV